MDAGLFIVGGIALLFLVGTGSILLSFKFDKPTIIISKKIHPMRIKHIKSDDLDVLVNDWNFNDTATVNLE